MKTLVTPCLAILSLAATAILPAHAQDGVRATYFRRSFVQYGFGPEKARLDGITYVIYFGPDINTTTGQMIGDLNDPDLAELRRRCRLTGTKIIGGILGGSPTFTMIGNPTVRAAAVQSVATWCRESRLDGIDIDFEHPANNTDRNNLSAFLSELRTALGPRPFLSAAVANISGTPSISTAVVNGKMDYLNIMSYDRQGEHATLAAANTDMDYYRGQGMLPSKLILGVPFYGTHVTNRDQRAYSGILAAYDPNPDPSVNSLGGYYFNGRDMIRTKGKMSMQKGGGVFTWIMDHDVFDGRSLLTAMHEGADQGQATLDGFEYPPFADPNSAYTRTGITLSSSNTRSEGSYGVNAVLNFDGAAWSETRLTSPTFAPISFPVGAAVKLDVFVPSSGPSGALVYFYDNQGRGARLENYTTGSAGWHGLSYPRANFQLLNGDFDFDNITRWMLLFTGTNGGTAVAPYTKTIVLDNLAIYGPGTKRPVRIDRDTDRDGVPDVCTAAGNVVWQDRFRHSTGVDPATVYTLPASTAYQWQWKDAAYGAKRRVFSGVMNFDNSPYATCAMSSPRQAPFSVNSGTVLHFELDVQQEMPTGTLIVDVMDDTGAYRRVFDFNVLHTKGLKPIDLPMSSFAGTADLSRLTGWRIFFEGHGATSAAHTGAVDIADIAWGKLPVGSQILSYDLDADGDGLTTFAEDRNGNGLVDAGETHPAKADTDGDGTFDGSELLTGTNPLDPTSSFHALPTLDEDGHFWIEWPSKPGSHFDVLTSTDLATWSVAIPNVPASTGTTTRKEVPNPSGTGFFKVRLLD